jgi:hypothetical protein
VYCEPALRLAACVRARKPPTVRERCEAGSLDRRLRLRGRSVRAENGVYRRPGLAVNFARTRWRYQLSSIKVEAARGTYVVRRKCID